MSLRRIAALLTLTLIPLAVLFATTMDWPLDRSASEATAAGSSIGAPGATATPIAEPPVPPTPEQVEAARQILVRDLDPARFFDELADLARDLAATAFVPPDPPLPDELTDLTYEEYRSIEYREEAALFRDASPFEVQLFHPGFLYPDPVRIHLLDDRGIEEIPFDPSRFTYGEAAARTDALAADLLPSDPGYAGLRIHYPLNDGASKDEVVVFQGASYFRLLGPGHAHGLSSRGLAVDVAVEGGEEFPTFRAFWLVRPPPDTESATFFALLDGPSVTGAYRFELRPGVNTVLAVEARLFARRDVAKLGVAPLTSMFLHGPNDEALFDDFRPRVHDSDGLLMHTSWGEWIWRPLTNREDIQITTLFDATPRGFGLVQRERDFDDYLDLEAQYHRRPSQWVAIESGDWGIGGLELMELPTPSEFNDNVVASWVPETPFLAGQSRTFRYRLETFDRRLDEQTLAQVERTRIGRDALPGQANAAPESQRRFVIDFEGGELPDLSPGDSVSALLVTSSGETSQPVVQPLPGGSGYRATFVLRPTGNEPADMRLFLQVPDRRVSETWSYLWIPGTAGS